MTATLENAAKNLLSDPPWMRVFKNTYDSIEDQLNKVDTVEDLVSIVNCFFFGMRIVLCSFVICTIVILILIWRYRYPPL